MHRDRHNINNIDKINGVYNQMYLINIMIVVPYILMLVIIVLVHHSHLILSINNSIQIKINNRDKNKT